MTSFINNKITLTPLTSQILPEIDFNILSTGITIKSNDQLATPRFIPYDQAGRCKECKATEVEVDFIVTKDGVTLYCSRIKGTRFIAFDKIYDLPGYCYFRIKNKGRVFNVPHGQIPTPHFIQNIPKHQQTITMNTPVMDSSISQTDKTLKEENNEISQEDWKNINEFLISPNEHIPL